MQEEWLPEPGGAKEPIRCSLNPRPTTRETLTRLDPEKPWEPMRAKKNSPKSEPKKNSKQIAVQEVDIDDVDKDKDEGSM